MSNKMGVYIIENKINGHRYIGSSSHSISRRWANHKYALRHNKHTNRYLQAAWNTREKFRSRVFSEETREKMRLAKLSNTNARKKAFDVVV